MILLSLCTSVEAQACQRWSYKILFFIELIQQMGDVTHFLHVIKSFFMIRKLPGPSQGCCSCSGRDNMMYHWNMPVTIVDVVTVNKTNILFCHYDRRLSKKFIVGTRQHNFMHRVFNQYTLDTYPKYMPPTMPRWSLNSHKYWSKYKE